MDWATSNGFLVHWINRAVGKISDSASIRIEHDLRLATDEPMIEISLGLYFSATVLYAFAAGIYATLPFLVLFQVGFLYTGLLSLFQQFAGDVVLKPMPEEEF